MRSSVALSSAQSEAKPQWRSAKVEKCCEILKMWPAKSSLVRDAACPEWNACSDSMRWGSRGH